MERIESAHGSPPERSLLASHVLAALARAQEGGRRTSLDDLVTEICARRAEVRAVVSALHREGLFDAIRMRLTLRGFALGRTFAGSELRPLRPRRAADQARAA
jgi:hypothetical protein